MRINNLKTSFIFFWAVIFLGTSCSKEEEPIPANIYLATVELVGTETAEQFKATIGDQLNSSFALFVQTGFEKYRITYRTTDTAGNDIIASGAVVVPTDISVPMALGSYQHGTLFNEQDAPSYFKAASEATLGNFFASTGMIIAMPDYVGYGASKKLPHPYEHNKGSAIPTVDFLRAVKEFIAQEKINWNEKTLLAGYSQGGYVTMATLKMLEEEFPTEFNIEGASCGAGAYDKTGTFNQFITEGTSGESTNNRSYIWVLLTYDRIYNINAPLDEYFIEPYRSEIEANGFNVNISKSINEVLNPELKSSFLSQGNSALKAAIADNDIFDWKPTTELKLFHGTADTYVPVINSERALEAMKARGASNVSLTLIEDGTHGSSIGDFFIETFAFFNSKK